MTIESEAAQLTTTFLDDVTSLLSVNSVSGTGGRAMQSALETLIPGVCFERWSSSTPAIGDDLYAKWTGNGTETLVLSGHFDTVPYSTDGRNDIDDQRLYGRGTFDMKGGLAMLCGVARTLAAQPQLYRELVVYLTADEEIRATPLKYADAFEPTTILCFEGGEWDGSVVTGRHGVGMLRLTLTGPGGRTQFPMAWDVPNPVVVMGQLTRMIERMAEKAWYQDRMHMVPVTVEVDTPLNVIAETATLVVCTRFPNKEVVEAMLNQLPERFGRCGLEWHWEEKFPPMVNDEVAVQTLLAQTSKLLGRQVDGIHRFGSSDLNQFGGHGHLLIDGLGVRGDGDHGREEYLELSSVGEQYELALATAYAALTPPSPSEN